MWSGFEEKVTKQEVGVFGGNVESQKVVAFPRVGHDMWCFGRESRESGAKCSRMPGEAYIMGFCANIIPSEVQTEKDDFP